MGDQLGDRARPRAHLANARTGLERTCVALRDQPRELARVVHHREVPIGRQRHQKRHAVPRRLLGPSHRRRGVAQRWRGAFDARLLDRVNLQHKTSRRGHERPKGRARHPRWQHCDGHRHGLYLRCDGLDPAAVIVKTRSCAVEIDLQFARLAAAGAGRRDGSARDRGQHRDRARVAEQLGRTRSDAQRKPDRHLRRRERRVIKRNDGGARNAVFPRDFGGKRDQAAVGRGRMINNRAAHRISPRALPDIDRLRHRRRRARRRRPQPAECVGECDRHHQRGRKARRADRDPSLSEFHEW